MSLHWFESIEEAQAIIECRRLDYPVLAGKTAVLTAASLVERVAEVAHDVEFVEEDSSLLPVAHERGVSP